MRFHSRGVAEVRDRARSGASARTFAGGGVPGMLHTRPGGIRAARGSPTRSKKIIID